MNQHLFDVAMGKVPADLVIKNGQIVNVYTGEIYEGGVAIAGDRIAASGDVDYAIGETTEIIDAEGNYIVPGFIDGHIHPESTALSPARFAEIALSRGTTSVFTDFHEIGVVGGMAAMEAAVEEAKATPLKFNWVMPSHIPFSPGLETSGGSIDPEIIRKALERDDVVGLSEVVSVYIAFEHPGLLQSIDDTRKAGKIVSGHGPEIEGPLANAFAALGVLNDHESLIAQDVLIRARRGIYVHLRHNLIVPTMPELIKAMTESKIDSRMLCLATDDTSAISLVNEGHIDYLIRTVMALGVDFVTAIQMATLNNACSFQKALEIGSLAPGRYADVNIVTGADDFKVLKTIANGKLVAENEKLVTPIDIPEHAPVLLNTFHLKEPVKAQDLVIPAKEGAASARMHVMRTLPWVPITEGGEAVLPVKDGYVNSDVSQDLLHIAVIERHHKTGNIGKAFIGGFALSAGAMASSIGHDHHNIVVMGADPQEMAVAANRVVELNGGIVLVKDGKVVKEIPLPIAGLLTDTDAWTLAQQRQELLAAAAELGCMVADAFMFLSFVTLAAIPAFAVTDKGYVDVMTQQIMDPVLEWV
ncbi:MAG: amidohydrolase family protein [Anaerolineaceae bacterium]|nr:amidohydrolase family protein [Anaerolineaceae bacterium]